jgi:hypothetical protein
MSDATPLDLDSLRPSDTPVFMTPAWLGCISWAIGVPEIVARFRQDTGVQWAPGRTPIERMVDQSSGFEREFIVQFIRWVNANIWGPIDGLGSEDDQ